MQWNIQIAFEVYRGRRRLFSLRNLLPCLRRLHKRNKDNVHNCYEKTRYANEQAALNAGWFNSKRFNKKLKAYACNICDGWHLARER